MTKHSSLTLQFFDKIVVGHPRLVIIFVLAAVSFLGYHAKNFKLDASAETLVLENDKDLRYSRLIDSRYGLQDYLVITYAPKDDLFSSPVLANLARLRNELKALKNVSSVVSILDVPLLESPPVPIKELVDNIQTLESPTVDRKLAKIEFKNNPLYQNLLISPDLKITALLIYFPKNEVYRNLLARRSYFQEKRAAGSLSDKEEIEFKAVQNRFNAHRDTMKKMRHQDIVDIYAIMDKFRPDAELFLGGVDKIADDLIRFIKNDLKVFGLGVLFFLILTLGIIFKKIRWILLPMLCCAFSAIAMIGLLGLFDWKVTVISSNFISLQLIITMAITIHLTVRYRELCSKSPDADQRRLILDTVRLMMKPCLYAALTTIAGFGSLLLCNILPVITFGWMMSAGIVVSLVMTFLLFPSVLVLIPKEIPSVRKQPFFPLTSLLAGFTESHGPAILVISGIAFIFSAVGISRLNVENSFIDYFKHSTEIYRGMKIIDRNLGGTTPFDVIVDLKKNESSGPGAEPVAAEKNNDEFGEFDEFDNASDKDRYWFTSDRMARIMKINDYLDNLPETGKVLSLGTMMKIAERLNHGKPLDNFQLALLYSQIPERYKRTVLTPYVSVKDNEIRYSIRVRDSEKSLQRDKLLKKIPNDLVVKLGLKPESVHLSGMLVLYNNMLQSLFRSQILTLGVVVLALMSMFMILFRSLKIACIAIFPNLLSIGVVLGVMGWMKIPMDMMTITIASISVGIAVDNTIHYIHRFGQEIAVDRNYIKAVHRCHGTIGHAMYYTSVTIIIGFSILVLSNFIPSIYFGLLTGLAMFIALIGALTLLPQLLVVIKPFGPGGGRNPENV